MANMPKQKSISRQLCLKLGFAALCSVVFQRPLTQFCSCVGRSVDLSHPRSGMKMGEISRPEGVYVVMKNNFTNLGKTSEIEEG